MEIHLLYMVWFTSLFFTLLSFYIRNNWAFPIVAGIGWIVVALSLAEVTLYGFDSMGNAHSYSINMGDPGTAGMLGSYYWYFGIGLVIILLTAKWVLLGEEVGEDV